MEKFKKWIAYGLLCIISGYLAILLASFVAFETAKKLMNNIVFEKFIILPCGNTYYTNRLFNNSWIEDDIDNSIPFIYVHNIFSDGNKTKYRLELNTCGKKLTEIRREKYSVPRDMKITYSLRGEFRNDVLLIINQKENDSNLSPSLDAWRVKFVEQKKDCLIVYTIDNIKYEYCDIDNQHPFKIAQNVYVPLIPF